MTMPTYGSAALSLLKRGYEVFPAVKGTKEPALKTWNSVEIDEQSVSAWLRETWHKENSIAVRTRWTPAIDIDVLNEEVSAILGKIVEDYFDDGFGFTIAPMRVGRAPKRLYLCKTDEPFPKLYRNVIDPDGKKHKIEILADGQYAIMYGMHPDTGKPFTWINGHQPINTPKSDLPTLNRIDAIELLDRIGDALKNIGWTVERIGGSLQQTHLTDDSDFGEGFKPRAKLSKSEVKQYMAELPNDNPDGDYDLWFNVGCALWHQSQGADWGYDLWVEWSELSPIHDESDMPYKWKSFHGERKSNPVTFATVIAMVNEKREKTRKKTFSALRERLETVESVEELEKIKDEIRECDLNPIQIDDVIDKVFRAYKRMKIEVARGTIKKELKARTKTVLPDIDDLEHALAKRVLADRFNNGEHLKQFAKTVWVYDGGVWRNSEYDYIESQVLRTLLDMKSKNDDVYISLAKATKEAGRDDRMGALVNSVAKIMLLICTQDGVSDPLDLRSRRSNSVINAKNGELWFEDDGSLSFNPHDPGHNLTSQISCKYDPQAACPTFKAAMRRVFSECRDPKEVERHWLEVMGTLIQPRRPEAMWVLMKGPGGNGKSFLMRIISELMGANSSFSGSLVEVSKGGDSHFTAALIGKLMFLDDDLKNDALLPDDWMKKLSEEKFMTANPKYGASFQFVARAVIVALANRWPATTDISHGMLRRAHVFETSHILSVEEKDPRHMDEILNHELPGVLNLLIAGWRRVLKRGGRYNPPDECLEARERWLSAGNATARFLGQVVTKDPSAAAYPAAELYALYRDWLHNSGENLKGIGRNSFYLALETEGYRFTNHSNRKMICGLRVLHTNFREDGFEDLRQDDFGEF